jgi:hypothetical protein
MSHLLKHTRLLVVAICCAALGAGASAIAGAGAATSSAKHSTGAAAKAHHRGAARARRRGLRGLAVRAVHADAVVHTKNGFKTVTLDRGTVASVSGDQLQITEGTPKATYKTVTLTIPSSAVVRDQGKKASLSDVKAGQRVLVYQGPKRERVIARNKK